MTLPATATTAPLRPTSMLRLRGRLLVRAADGAVRAEPDVGRIAAFVGDPNNVVWLDLEAPGEAEAALLREQMHIHPLAIEDFLHRGQRAKVDEYEGYLFLTLHFPQQASNQALDSGQLAIGEVDCLLGPNFLITVHDQHSPECDALYQQWQADPADFARGADFILYRLSDRLMDRFFPILEIMDDRIDRLEDELVAKPTRNCLNQIFGYKQDLLKLRKMVSPTREVFNALSRRGHPFIQDRTTVYFRDVYDHLVRAYEMVDSYRDLLSNALDAYLSTVSNNLNVVMKRLTIVSTIFLPLTFITGFFGMNFDALPYHHPAFLALSLLVMAIVPLAMLYWFWRSGWL